MHAISGHQEEVKNIEGCLGKNVLTLALKGPSRSQYRQAKLSIQI